MRAAFFAQNVSEKDFEDFIRTGVVQLPAPDVGEPFVDADDIADVVVAALIEDGRHGQLYEVTDPRRSTFAGAVAEIATAAGRELRYRRLPAEDFIAGLVEQRIPHREARVFAEISSTVLDGRNEHLMRRRRTGSAPRPTRLHRIRLRRRHNGRLGFLTRHRRPRPPGPPENLTRSTMLDTSRGIVIVLATLAVGLLAGLFYSFTVAVMPGLARTDDRTFVQAMQQINIAIVNPWFLFSFLGAPLLVALACVLFYVGGNRAPLPWLLLALVFAVATFVITSALNIPLNNALDAARQDPSAITAPAGTRTNFEATWVRWNNIRTLTSTGALLFMAWALVQYGRTRELTAVT